MDNDRKKILLFAFTCSPYKGSESRSGWERALEISREFETWVITECGNEHDIMRYCELHGHPSGLHFLYVRKGRIEERLFGCLLFFYADYNIWHRRAYRLARILHTFIGFDIAHNLTICGYREPGYLCDLGIPYVWGPIGGMQYYPWRFLTHAGLKGGLVELIRNIANFLQFRFGARIGKSLIKARVVLAANSLQQKYISRVYGVTSKVVPDVGTSTLTTKDPKTYTDPGTLKILWSGTFEHRKALHILMHALSRLPQDLEYELRILGDGYMRSAWRELSAKAGIEPHCTWLGWLPYDLAIKQYEWADILVFTSLSDTTGSVVLEAMSNGVPVVCFDHCGAGELVTDGSGIKIPVTTPDQAVSRLSCIIEMLCNDKSPLAALSFGALKRAEEYRWSCNGKKLIMAYQQALLPSGKEAEAGKETMEQTSSGNTKPMISVIVINRNREKALAKCLESVAMQTYRPLEVVVLDHGSTDSSPKVIKDFMMNAGAMDINVRYLSSELMGVAASRNYTTGFAKGDLLCFIDNDACFTRPDDLDSTAELFEASPACALVSYRILLADTSDVDPFAWVFRRPKELWAERPFKTFTFTGGGFCVRRHAFTDAGGFWGHLKYSREEEDLGMALIEMGWEINYFPNVAIRHYSDQSGRSSVLQRRHTELHNGLMVLWRRFPVPLALAAMCARTASMIVKNISREKGAFKHLISAVPAAIADWRDNSLIRKPISFRAAFRYFALHLSKEKAG